jgi:hypothetical protein
VPRTTLLLEDDAMKVARAHAQRLHLSLGEAVSELIRKATDQPLMTEERNGLRVLRLNRRSPKISSSLVDQLRDDMP